MNYMKNITKILLIVGIVLSGVSCNKFFDDMKPTDKVSDKSAWENQAATDLYVNNFYEYIHVYGQFGDQQFNGNLTEGLTETFKYGSPITGTRAGDCNNYVFTPETLSSAGTFPSKLKVYGSIVSTDSKVTD